MLDSQRNINIRNIPTDTPRPVKVQHAKRGPMERLGELELHDLMAQDAVACNKAANTGPTPQQIENGRRGARPATQAVIKGRVFQHLGAVDDWRDRDQIVDALGITKQQASNALYGLVTEGALVKRIVPRGGFKGGNKGQWRIKEDAQ